MYYTVFNENLVFFFSHCNFVHTCFHFFLYKTYPFPVLLLATYDFHSFYFICCHLFTIFLLFIARNQLNLKNFCLISHCLHSLFMFENCTFDNQPNVKQIGRYRIFSNTNHMESADCFDLFWMVLNGFKLLNTHSLCKITC